MYYIYCKMSKSLVYCKSTILDKSDGLMNTIFDTTPRGFTNIYSNQSNFLKSSKNVTGKKIKFG